jgi:co-chaperonin GroES (HSP10)
MRKIAMLNESGVEPVGHALLVLPLEDKESEVIFIPESVRRQNRMAEQRGVVVEVGPNCWDNERSPRCKVGDTIIFGKYAGAMTPGVDGKVYRVINDTEVYLRLKPGADLPPLHDPARVPMGAEGGGVVE